MNTTIKLALMNSFCAGICFMVLLQGMLMHEGFSIMAGAIGVTVNIWAVMNAWPKLSAL